MNAALQLYLKVVGCLTANTIGILDRYTPEHRRFLSSGFVCAGCQATLTTRWLLADVNCFSPDGEAVPLMLARTKGKYFGCPRCSHRWELRNGWQKRAD